MRQSKQRSALYAVRPEAGLFSILSAVWDGSPTVYLRALADSIHIQNPDGATEWVIVDNGSSDTALLDLLEQLSCWKWVKIVRLQSNSGIVGGLRAGLEAATGRYTLSVDGDDLLYSDALSTVAHYLREHKYPLVFYTDEDKVRGMRLSEAYLKPDWDPVLILNSPYIAHLGGVDRRTAIELGAYTDKATEGSPDWDLFIRFLSAGHSAQHIPEVVYSWRMHSTSTAESVTHKSYIHSSQKAVLERYVRSLPNPLAFEVAESSWSGVVPQFRIMKRKAGAFRTVEIVLDAATTLASELAGAADRADSQDASLVLRMANLAVNSDIWMQEAETLFELHPDAVMLGGRVLSSNKFIWEAGSFFGFQGVCGDPYRGFRATDPGYFGDLWKRRSVSAVSTRFAIVRPEFLCEVLQTLPASATVAFLGAWAGAHAMRTGKRIVYSPFIGGTSPQAPLWECAESEKQLFAKLNEDLIPDTRFYSRHFSRTRPFRVDG